MLVSCPTNVGKRSRLSANSLVAALVVVCAFLWSALWPAAGVAAASSPVASSDRSPYLVIHLDAVSSATFFELYDSGCLPNIEGAFGNGKVVRQAVSPFCPGTETLYPRIVNGNGQFDACPTAWEYVDRTTGSHTTHTETAVGLFSILPRYALTQAIHALPGLEWLSGWGLLNVGRLLRDYSGDAGPQVARRRDVLRQFIQIAHSAWRGVGHLDSPARRMRNSARARCNWALQVPSAIPSIAPVSACE